MAYKKIKLKDYIEVTKDHFELFDLYPIVQVDGIYQANGEQYDLVGKITNLSSNYTNLNSNYTNLNSTVTKQQTAIEGNTSNINSLSSQLTALDGQVDGNIASINGLKETVGKHTTTLSTKLNTNLNNIQDTVDSISNQDEVIIRKQTGTDSKGIAVYVSRAISLQHFVTGLSNQHAFFRGYFASETELLASKDASQVGDYAFVYDDKIKDTVMYVYRDPDGPGTAHTASWVRTGAKQYVTTADFTKFKNSIICADNATVVQTARNYDTTQGTIAEAINSKLDKIALSNIVYTNAAANAPSSLPYSPELTKNSIAQRTALGLLKVETIDDDVDAKKDNKFAVNKEYLNSRGFQTVSAANAKYVAKLDIHYNGSVETPGDPGFAIGDLTGDFDKYLTFLEGKVYYGSSSPDMNENGDALDTATELATKNDIKTNFSFANKTAYDTVEVKLGTDKKLYVKPSIQYEIL